MHAQTDFDACNLSTMQALDQRQAPPRLASCLYWDLGYIVPPTSMPLIDAADSKPAHVYMAVLLTNNRQGFDCAALNTECKQCVWLKQLTRFGIVTS